MYLLYKDLFAMFIFADDDDEEDNTLMKILDI